MDSSDTFRLLIGTRNDGKITELSELFEGLNVDLVSLNDLGITNEVEETGSTFLENAKLKAAGYAIRRGTYTLADDSGLEVDALGNAPGVHSARYGGETAPYSEKLAKLLSEMPEGRSRRARFVCEMAVADKQGNILFSAEGTCNGTIAPEPRGKNGFGYDPIFIPEGHTETFGELSDDIKQEISHRSRAARKIIRYLLDFIEV